MPGQNPEKPDLSFLEDDEPDPQPRSIRDCVREELESLSERINRLEGKEDTEGVRDCRLAEHMTQRELAEAAGISVVYLSNIENGKRNPSISVAYRIADVLGRDVTDVFPPSEYMDEPNPTTK